MEKIRVVIAGFGNVGRGVLASIRNNPDMELVGVVSRSPERVKKELADIPVMPIADSEAWLAAFRPDVAILCGGSKNDLPKQGPMMAKLVNTVDSFDNHSRIPEYFAEMDAAAKAAGHVSVISTGWDPGIFSLERVLGGAFIPGARAYGFYGLGPKGGLSMGHSDALRTIPGVKDARQFTHAIPEAIERVRRGENPDFQPGDMHTRECFVVVEEGADKASRNWMKSTRGSRTTDWRLPPARPATAMPLWPSTAVSGGAIRKRPPTCLWRMPGRWSASPAKGARGRSPSSTFRRATSPRCRARSCSSTGCNCCHTSEKEKNSAASRE